MGSHARVRLVSCALTVLCLPAVSHAAERGPRTAQITLTRPTERWVVQRDANDRADMAIEGTAPTGTARIEARATLGNGATRGQAVDWTAIAAGKAITGGTFRGTIALPAGGWYALEVRAVRGEDVLGTARVERVGVGDVFITAGQSNSANCGQPRQEAVEDLVVYFNGTAFVRARDPMPGAFGGGGTPWPILGDLLARSSRVPVCFRSATLTWTQVKNWLPGVTCKRCELYKTLVERARWFGVRGVRAVLWHQGESDSLARTSAQQYHDRLATIIRSMRKDIGYDVDWFVSGASFHPGSRKPAEDTVLAGQKLLWRNKVALQGPCTDDLLGPTYRHDKVHFNQRGLGIVAERWYAAIWVRHLAARP